jgi:ABC-type dipeptide/oligopeptide/nickel transport system permease subunit
VSPSDPGPEGPRAEHHQVADVAGEDLATEPTTGLPTEAKLFFGLAGFSALLGTVYAATTGYTGEHVEYAGTFALYAVAVFAGFFGWFLLLTVRRIQGDVEALEEAHAAGDETVDDVLYLPTQSIWPLGIAVGMSLVLAGVPLGLWVMIPGVALFVHSLIGFAHQSRTRG